MNRTIVTACLSALFLGVVAWAARQDGAPPMHKPAKEHEWLKQVVGEWESEGEAMMGPDQPPIKLKGTESGRMVGGFRIEKDGKWVTLLTMTSKRKK